MAISLLVWQIGKQTSKQTNKQTNNSKSSTVLQIKNYILLPAYAFLATKYFYKLPSASFVQIKCITRNLKRLLKVLISWRFRLSQDLSSSILPVHRWRNRSKITKTHRPGGTWVKFCWVCAAGISQPLCHYSLFLVYFMANYKRHLSHFWAIDLLTLKVPKKCDPILVTLLKMLEKVTPL